MSVRLVCFEPSAFMVKTSKLPFEEGGVLGFEQAGAASERAVCSELVLWSRSSRVASIPFGWELANHSACA